MDPIPVRLPDELHARVDQIADRLSLSRSAVLRLAIQQWLDAEELHGTNPLLLRERGPLQGAPEPVLGKRVALNDPPMGGKSDYKSKG
jgi:hypothetical protein